MSAGKTNKIVVKGARSHNLKDIDVEIPKDKLVVITGLSGSGKSSLAFDTIYAEGQRKYVESLSSYARQFLGMMEKADVDLIEGLSPAISIDQKSSGHNPRSTVGTITEIYDYLRLLYARAGHPHSPVSGKRLESQTVQQIVDRILAFPENNAQKKIKIMLLAPVVKNRKGTYEELFQRYLSQGFIRARVDGEVYSLEEDIKLDRYKKHTIDVIIDRLVVVSGKKDDDFKKRLTDSVETALNLGDREILVNIIDEKKDEFFSEKLVDPETGESFQQIEPHTFSFNSPHGACPKCDGLGHIREIDERLVYNPRLTISEGGLFPWSKMADNPDSWHMRILKAVADNEGFSIREPLGQLNKAHLNTVLYGAGDKKFNFKYTNRSNGSNSTVSARYEGLIPSLMRRYQQTDSDYIRKDIEQYMHEMKCPQCKGARLTDVALAVTIEDTNIYELTHLPLKKFKPWLEEIKSSSNPDSLTKQELTIVRQVIKEIEARTDFLLAVGLDYLSLGRTARTLSGGEAQRIRLASQIGTGLSGVLYVLDEPSIGLHQRDNSRLIKTLQNLRDLGNTILVVEHDKDTILTADHVIDMGPGAGEHGGKIVSEGTPAQIKKDKKSLTGRYLSGKAEINLDEIKTLAKQINNVPDGMLKSEEGSKLTLIGAKHNNLKNISVDFPLGKFISVTGVSGSGKSSLVNETLTRILKKQFYRSKDIPGTYEKLEGIDHVDKIVEIDQSAIGRTPRSNPATYTGVFTNIRDIFSQTRESKVRGYKPGRFSFNVRGGRCETCQGDGLLKIEMQFLPDVYVQCDVCKGLRYNRETLQIDYKGKNIAEVLDMTVKTALEFFKNIPPIKNKLITLDQVGLGYIRLGQSATTLSGGEAQRVKLSSELSKRSTGKTVYVLDEPTTGLHIDDIKKLLVVLHSLVERGNTVIVIE
ncbi:MAG: excinuclease ABC subunit UvrA, partial [Candidatus Dojkabacteria bacterium]